MASVFDVSKYILDTIGGRISAMKLQKLCYYSQAWHLVWDGVPLFHEDFLKWDNGPVCRELFDLHKGEFYIDSGIIAVSLLSKDGISGMEKLNVEQVLEDYGKYTGVQLSELTHSEEPWLQTEKDEVITKEMIKEFYSSLMYNAQK
ncbi:MAG: DUF4065 domain-containing protein [Holosporaceae bacterium]|jgi:uncharacterized phage-associated protein|nr:DUF4065 domain-containing protein [Holosporaceae bacterium]